MSNQYSHRDWIRFREQGIKLDDGRCVRCQRGRPEVVLQLHHRFYIAGRKPWEYEYEDCETLCKSCHAQEHGIIMPQSGWAFLSSDDLGDLCGNCEDCGQDLRYIYLIQHPAWGFLSVGTDCCDRLTATEEASAILTAIQNRNERRKTFLSSKRWKIHESGNISIRQSGRSAYIFPRAGKFRIGIGDVEGNADYETQLEAKIRMFDFFDSGEAADFFAKRREAKEKEKTASSGQVGGAM